jgi:hypothetical protein
MSRTLDEVGVVWLCPECGHGHRAGVALGNAALGDEQCCIRGCLNAASVQNTIRGSRWEVTHSYCARCYERLTNGEAGSGVDWRRVSVRRPA